MGAFHQRGVTSMGSSLFDMPPAVSTSVDFAGYFFKGWWKLKNNIYSLQVDVGSGSPCAVDVIGSNTGGLPGFVKTNNYIQHSLKLITK